jgi:hypothetical protein
MIAGMNCASEVIQGKKLVVGPDKVAEQQYPARGRIAKIDLPIGSPKVKSRFPQDECADEEELRAPSGFNASALSAHGPSEAVPSKGQLTSLGFVKSDMTQMAQDSLAPQDKSPLLAYYARNESIPL